jgi:hypothetical protein
MEATMPSTIAIKHDVTDQFLADVLTTAVESGGHALWYWEGFSMIDMDRAISRIPDANTRTMVDVKVGEPGSEQEHLTRLGHLSVYRIKFACDHSAKEDSDGQGEYIIDLEDVAKGIQWILDGTVPVASRLGAMVAMAVAEGEADIDAEGADVIVQAAAFGELVFG